jgi:hypothetical protein
LINGSTINESIKHTYENEPSEFWYGHNGITAICDKVIEKQGNILAIKNPQIINGGQTIRTLSSSRERTNATVLFKIMELQRNLPESFIRDIILRTNQANKIFTYDLRSHDRFQVTLAKEFIKHKIFYERRRGDWDFAKNSHPGFDKVTSRDMAKILVSANSDLGGVKTAKKNIEALFEDHIYEKIFNIGFEEVLFKYKTFKLIEKLLKDINYKNTKVSERRSFNYTCFSIIWECLKSYKNTSVAINKVAINPDIFKKDKFIKTMNNVTKAVFASIWDKYLIVVKKERMYITDFQKSPKYVELLMNKLVPKFKNRVRKSIDIII